MDNRVRDLDQIQELDGDDRGRRVGTILLATASVVGLTFAIGVVVGRAAEPVEKADDPLARLEQARLAAPPQAPRPGATAIPKVDAAELSFPSTLSDEEDRPEVLAALKAAAAEEAALSGEPRVQPGIDAQPIADSEEAELQRAEPAMEEADAAEQMVAAIPAAVAGGSGSRSLPRTARHDPLVAAAIRSDAPATVAPRGHDGEYTLQVISHDRPEPSRAFAEGLRAKGHSAFVAAADIPDRGRYYRVRIGPFKTRLLAEDYRRRFEDEEHMNTFVVRLKDDDKHE